MVRAGKAVSDRWAARPVLGASLRLLALLGPIAIGFAVALGLAAVLPPAGSRLGQVGWWVAVMGGSALALFASDRLARRLLPLAILLELSLIFPDRAPSRLRAARTASVRDIDQRLARLRGSGVKMEPYQAAETVVTLVGILGLHDKRTRGHSERVRAFTDMLTGELGLDEDARMRLRWAALVHDLGKLTIPAGVLNAAGQLDDDGWEMMHRHPEEGVRLLAGLLPWLGEWGDAVGQHHERYDGTGYPKGLAGEDIAYAARIVALADSFEVMTSARSYKTSRSAAWARGELTRCAGSQFDPALVRAFLGISIGRLRWVLGPVTWLAELPFVATADRAGQTAKVASVTALAGALLFVGGMPQGGTPLPAPGGGSLAEASETAPRPGGWGTSTGLWAEASLSPGGHAGEELLGAAARSDQLLAAALGSTAEPGSTSATGGARSGTGEAGSGTGSSTDEAAVGTSATGGSSEAGGAGTPAKQPASEPAKKPASEPAKQPAAQPAPQPVKADQGPALAPVYYLTPRGMQRTPMQHQETLSVATGQTRVFDTRLERAVVLPSSRDLVLFVNFPTRQGSAKVGVRLQHCATGGCRVLSEGLVTQDKGSQRDFQEHVVQLVRSAAQDDRLPAGDVLRIEVTFLEPGARGPGRIAFGSSATPTRLRFPA